MAVVSIRITCMLKGCRRPAEFYLRRPLRDGSFQAGLVCDEHEQQYGDANLRKLAREMTGK